jgi:thioredoxin 1
VRGERRGKDGLTGLAILGALLVAACGGDGPSPTTSSSLPSSSSMPSAVVSLHEGDFAGTVARGVSLVEFFHPACPHCRAMEPVVEQLATDFVGQALVGQVDVTTEPSLTRTWGVQAYPTFVVLKDGQEHGRWRGETSYARLAGMIRDALDAP